MFVAVAVVVVVVAVGADMDVDVAELPVRFALRLTRLLHFGMRAEANGRRSMAQLLTSCRLNPRSSHHTTAHSFIPSCCTGEGLAVACLNLLVIR